MKKLIAVLFVLASGCIDERAVVREAFDGCDGNEEAFHGKWSECMKLGGDVATCAVYAQELVCHGKPLGKAADEYEIKLLRRRLNDSRRKAGEYYNQLIALKGCYNWDHFYENCDGFASNSLILCEGFDGPQDVCTKENWQSYQTTLRYGLPLETP